MLSLINIQTIFNNLSLHPSMFSLDMVPSSLLLPLTFAQYILLIISLPPFFSICPNHYKTAASLHSPGCSKIDHHIPKYIHLFINLLFHCYSHVTLLTRVWHFHHFALLNISLTLFFHTHYTICRNSWAGLGTLEGHVVMTTVCYCILHCCPPPYPQKLRNSYKYVLANYDFQLCLLKLHTWLFFTC